MLDELQNFERFEISTWLVDGMVKRPLAIVRQFSKTAVLSLAICTSGAVNAAYLTNPIFPSPIESAYGQSGQENNFVEDLTQGFEPRALNVSLRKVGSLKPIWVSISGSAPNPKSVRAATIIAHQIRATVSPSIGVDGDGNIILHFVKGEAEAYLTVEPHKLHLVCLVPGLQNTYIDDEPFPGKKLPENIRQVLAVF